jgi:multisubunit Na+/H+ antiporter MnhE subunit
MLKGILIGLILSAGILFTCDKFIGNGNVSNALGYILAFFVMLICCLITAIFMKNKSVTLSVALKTTAIITSISLVLYINYFTANFFTNFHF